VPITEHQKLIGLAKCLEEQVIEAGRRQKREATTRKVLMQKLAKHKETARAWMNRCQNLKRKQGDPESSPFPKPREVSSDVDLEDIIDAEGNLILPQTGTKKTKSGAEDLPLAGGVAPELGAAVGCPDVVDFSKPPLPPGVVDDDQPISAREAKRRRVGKAEAASHPNPKPPASSAPIAPTGSRSPFRRLETWDLDEISDAKELRAAPSEELAEVLRHDRSQSEPVEAVDSIFVGRQQDNRVDLGSNLARHVSVPPPDQPRRRHSDGSLSGSQGASEASETQWPVNPVEDRPVTIKREPSWERMPLSSHALRRITEDGDEFGSPKEKPKDGSGKSTGRAKKSAASAKKSSKLLHSLLEGQENLENVPPLEVSPSDVSRLKRMSAATKQPNQTPRTPGRDITNTSRGQQESRPKTRLRKLPPEQLYLSDFKINPVANQGLDYAWTDAVYGNERKCFPGCTDARCCGGALRALAATLAPTLTRLPFPEDPEDASLDDDELLVKWHLGAGGWDRRRHCAMSAAERARVLLDARTRLLADRHGKHRAVGQRHVTPPGFWDIGMPDSQEVEKMHAEAAKIDRRIVEERRAEALRGGRWLFRDE
jgi:hypothetical protein